jgi:2',3'-cyclic-nucleotide 2'-phosphodiesterase
VVLREVEAIRHRTRVIILDFHAEATSEKMAMGWHLDGKVTAVFGTHTHVQTADERVLPNGTAYITDVGMTGPHDSIIGMDKDASLARFLNGMPSKFEPATGNPRLNGVVIDADEETGRANGITRISYSAQDLERLASGGDAAEAASLRRKEQKVGADL